MGQHVGLLQQIRRDWLDRATFEDDMSLRCVYLDLNTHPNDTLICLLQLAGEAYADKPPSQIAPEVLRPVQSSGATCFFHATIGHPPSISDLTPVLLCTFDAMRLANNLRATRHDG